MPKLPRVSGAETLKVLQRLGFEKVRQSGSHVVVRKGARGCMIPMHGELKVGTLAGLLRQADVSPEDFIANL
jgi:predicted RNA binding protein YcfA (HicA-like mRNA interferase family)